MFSTLWLFSASKSAICITLCNTIMTKGSEILGFSCFSVSYLFITDQGTNLSHAMRGKIWIIFSAYFYYFQQKNAYFVHISKKFRKKKKMFLQINFLFFPCTSKTNRIGFKQSISDIIILNRKYFCIKYNYFCF